MRYGSYKSNKRQAVSVELSNYKLRRSDGFVESHSDS